MQIKDTVEPILNTQGEMCRNSRVTFVPSSISNNRLEDLVCIFSDKFEDCHRFIDDRIIGKCSKGIDRKQVLNSKMA